MSIVEEEADEAMYWIELLVESESVKQERVVSLLDEANQIVAIVVSSIRTARLVKQETMNEQIRNPQSMNGGLCFASS